MKKLLAVIPLMLLLIGCANDPEYQEEKKQRRIELTPSAPITDRYESEVVIGYFCCSIQKANAWLVEQEKNGYKYDQAIHDSGDLIIVMKKPEKVFP